MIKTREHGSGSQVLKNQDSYSAKIKLTEMFPEMSFRYSVESRIEDKSRELSWHFRFPGMSTHHSHYSRRNIKYRNHHGVEKDRPYVSVSQIRIVNLGLHNFAGRIPGSGLPEKSGRGCVAKFFLTLTLFSTTFPVLPHQKLDTQLMTIMACSVALNISYVGLLLMVLSIMMKR